MFRPRRSAPPLPESVKVAEVVKAYYDAGSRPASHLNPQPEARFERPGEAVADPDPAPVTVAPFAETAKSETPRDSPPVHKSLDELAEELEAFIEVIRYGDDLGSTRDPE